MTVIKYNGNIRAQRQCLVESMKIIPARWLSRSWPWWLASGLLLVQFLPVLWLQEWVLAGAALGGFLLFIRSGRDFVIAALLVSVGAAWGSYRGGETLNQGLPESLIKQDVLVRGVVSDLPQQRRHALRFRFDIDTLRLGQQAYDFGGTVLLNWYDKPRPDLQVGDQWQFTIRLKPAHGALNPGGFVYEKWLFSQGIRATGYVRESENAQLISPSDGRYFVGQFRARVKQFIEAKNLSMGGILSALAVGERSGITTRQWQVFRDTGTAHLIAISGLHIGLVASLIYFLAQVLWRHTLLVPSLFPAQHVARFAALIGAGIYAALAGFALPTVRALTMLLAYFCLQWLGRNPGVLFTLGFILMGVLLVDPLAPLGAGLWLSFGAVAAIAYVASPSVQTDKEEAPEVFAPNLREKMGHYLLQWTRVQWAVFIGLLPLMLLFFQQFSVVSLFANYLAIPVIGMLSVPLILLAILCIALGWVSAASALLTLANALIELIWPLLEGMADWPFSIWLDAAPPLWAVAVAILGAVTLLAAKSTNLRVLGLIGLMPLFLPNHTEPGRDSFEVWVVDVGQGLAVLVQTGQHALLYDGGIKYDAGFDSGREIILPLMRQRGIHKLDVVIASHQNIDHYGGLGAVLDENTDALRYSSAAFYADSLPCERGVNWQWEGVDFEFLHPLPNNPGSDNNDSCVLKISSRFGSILLTGDIERKAEKALLARTTQGQLQADVILAPHHGSRTSSGAVFIDRVQPKLVVISAGYLNRFKHPHELVVQRYIQAQTRVLNTATSGAVQIKFDESGVVTKPWRRQLHRYWLSRFKAARQIKFLPRRVDAESN